MKQRTARSGETNGDAFDRFTIGHAAVGVILGLARLPPWAAIVVSVGWEFLERPLKDRYPALFPHASQDTFANAMVDATAMIAGYAAMRALPTKP